jgi:hypothetical protein
MFARVITVQTAVDNFAQLLTASEERLPAEREAPGFKINTPAVEIFEVELQA